MSWTSSSPIRWPAPACRSGCRPAPPPGTPSRSTSGSWSAAPATSTSTRRRWANANCSNSPGTSATSPTTCSRRCGSAPTTSSCCGPALCPHHALVFRARGRSYRELPLRIAELGGMYRSERSGVLGGLSRVRAISLNDAHNFCAPEQVGAEVAEILGLIRAAHAALGVRPAGLPAVVARAGREVRRRRRAVGPRGGPAPRRAGRGGVRRGARRGRLLRPEDRHPDRRRGRPGVDHLHHPTRLRQAGAVRPVVHRLPTAAGVGR